MKVKVAFIDDNKNLLSAVEIIPELQEKFEFFLFNNPLIALSKIKEIKPDIILCDQVMPEMLGIDVLKKCMELSPKSKRVLITATKGSLPATETQFGPSLLLQDFIEKPFENIDFVRRLTIVHESLQASDVVDGQFQLKEQHLMNTTSRNDDMIALLSSKTDELENAQNKIKELTSLLAHMKSDRDSLKTEVDEFRRVKKLENEKAKLKILPFRKAA